MKKTVKIIFLVSIFMIPFFTMSTDNVLAGFGGGSGKYPKGLVTSVFITDESDDGVIVEGEGIWVNLLIKNIGEASGNINVHVYLTGSGMNNAYAGYTYTGSIPVNAEVLRSKFIPFTFSSYGYTYHLYQGSYTVSKLSIVDNRAHYQYPNTPFTVLPPGNSHISGIVESYCNEPVEGAEVKLVNSGGLVIITDFTDSLGEYDLYTDVSTNQHTLQVTHGDYFRVEESMVPSGIVLQDFEMKHATIPGLSTSRTGSYNKDIKIATTNTVLNQQCLDYLQDSAFSIYDYYDPLYWGQTENSFYSSASYSTLDYYRSPLGIRSYEFSLALQGTVLSGASNVPYEPVMLLSGTDELHPAYLDYVDLTMSLLGTHEDGDRIKIVGATSNKSQKHFDNQYQIDTYPWNSPNILEDPDFLDAYKWIETNPYPSENTITIGNFDSLLKMTNINDQQLFVETQQVHAFGTSQQFLSIYFEGHRGISADNGNDVGVELLLTLEDNSQVTYSPSELKLGRYDTEWNSYYIILDSLSTYGSKVSSVQVKVSNNEITLAEFDRIYVGAGKWVITEDSGNPISTDNLEIWKEEQHNAEEFGEFVEDMALGMHGLGLALHLIPSHVSHGLGTALSLGSFLLDLFPVPEAHTWQADHINPSFTGTMHFQGSDLPNSELRTFANQAAIQAHIDLVSSGTKSFKIEITYHFQYIDEYEYVGSTSTTSRTETIIINLLDDLF